MVIGAGSGLLGTAALFGVFIYRKPKARPDRTTLKALEQQAPKLQIISAFALSLALLCTIIFLAVPALQTVAAIIGGLSIAVAFALSLPLLKIARISRVAPSLDDERSQANLAKAYRNAFTGTFQICLLGGLFFKFSSATIETGTALYLLGFTSITLLMNFTAFYEWRDNRSGEK